MSHTLEPDSYRDLVEKGLEAVSPGWEKVKKRRV